MVREGNGHGEDTAPPLGARDSGHLADPDLGRTEGEKGRRRRRGELANPPPWVACRPRPLDPLDLDRTVRIPHRVGLEEGPPHLIRRIGGGDRVDPSVGGLDPHPEPRSIAMNHPVSRAFPRPQGEPAGKEPSRLVELPGRLEGALLRGPESPAERGGTMATKEPSPLVPREHTKIEAGMRGPREGLRILEVYDIIADGQSTPPPSPRESRLSEGRDPEPDAARLDAPTRAPLPGSRP